MSLLATSHLGRLLPLTLLVVGGITSLIAQIWIFPADVEPDDWREPAAYVKEHIGDRDVVRVHPSWTADPLPHLADVGERVRRQHFPLEEDLQDVERIWILSETDRLDGALDRIPFSVDKPTLERFGHVTVARVEVPNSSQFDYEMLEHLDEATVERVETDGETRTCSNWDEADWRWDCGAQDQFLYVGRELLVLNDDPHRCIWAHPLDKGRPLRITFPDVSLSKTLRLRAGLNFRASLSKRGTDVQFRVQIGDRTALEHTYGARTSTWFPHDIDTTERSGEEVDVTVEIRSDKVKDRYFCFNGWVSDRPPASGTESRRAPSP